MCGGPVWNSFAVNPRNRLHQQSLETECLLSELDFCLKSRSVKCFHQSSLLSLGDCLLGPTTRKLSPAQYLQCESKKSPLGDLTFFHFFHKRLRICNRFFTHLLNVSIFARLQIFIQLSPILTKLCHIKRNYPVHIICAKCP